MYIWTFFYKKQRLYNKKTDKKLYNIDVQKSTSTPPNKYISIIKCIENKLWQHNYLGKLQLHNPMKNWNKEKPYINVWWFPEKKSRKKKPPLPIFSFKPDHPKLNSSFIYWLVMQIPTHNNSASSPNVASNTIALLSNQTTPKVNSHHFHKTFYPPPTKNRVSQQIVKPEKLQKKQLNLPQTNCNSEMNYHLSTPFLHITHDDIMIHQEGDS